jgi:serine/threonine-protein kinase
MDTLVARALAKDPADRFASAGELGRAAMLAVAGTPDTEPIAVPEMRAPRLRVADASFAEAATVSRAQPAPTVVTRGEAAPLTAASSP